MDQDDKNAPADLRITGTRTVAELQTMNTSLLPAWSLVMLSTGVLYVFNKTKTVPAGTDIQPVSGPGIWEEYIPGAPSTPYLSAFWYVTNPYYSISADVNWVTFGVGGSHGAPPNAAVLFGGPDWVAVEDSGDETFGLQAAGYSGEFIATLTATLVRATSPATPILLGIDLESSTVVGTTADLLDGSNGVMVPEYVASGGNGYPGASISVQRRFVYDGSLIQPIIRKTIAVGDEIAIARMQLTVAPVIS